MILAKINVSIEKLKKNILNNIYREIIIFLGLKKMIYIQKI